MKDIFRYNNDPIPGCSFKISPSSIGKFFSYPSIWYKEQVLEQKEFIASTSTILGTIVHACAEAYVKKIDITREDIEEYIDETMASMPEFENIDKDIIIDKYPDMAMTLVNKYVRSNKPSEVETQVYARVLDDIFVKGSVDNRTGDCIVDYKTYNSTTKPTKFPFEYRIQLLAYAYAFRAKGIPINRIRLVYVNRAIDTRGISEKTGKPIGKLTPPDITVLTEILTPEDWILIEDTLMLIAETIKVARANPELVHLLFKSMKLKGGVNAGN